MTNVPFPMKPIFSQPIDRTAITLMTVLSVAIAFLLWNGDHALPKVRDFSWEGKQVGAEDNSFILTFSRPMAHATVEENLKITPSLKPGKFSWVGRKMAYRLVEPAPYGTTFKVTLEGARDGLTGAGENGHLIEPFTGHFRSRDRAFVYIGVDGEEEGRLILVNLSLDKPKPVILTPKDLMVMDFKIYPRGERILFAATDRNGKDKSLLEQELFTVTTGINPLSPPNFQAPETPVKQAETAGRINKILDSKEYQNLQFDLSADGQNIVVQRANRLHPGEDFGLWLLTDGEKPKPLHNQPGGEFLIAPDSSAIAIAQGQGIAILPLKPQAEPLDFLAKFGRVLSFGKDNSAAMVKYNSDYTRSLFLVNNQGVEKELLRTTGSILSAQFDPMNQTLYCLLTQLMKGKDYQEQPFLAAIDLATGNLKPLLVLPNQRDIQMSLSPDGLALLFDQISTANQSQGMLPDNTPRTSDGRPIATSRLWLLPVISTTTSPDTAPKLQPEDLLLSGFHPRWLP